MKYDINTIEDLFSDLYNRNHLGYLQKKHLYKLNDYTYIQ